MVIKMSIDEYFDYSSQYMKLYTKSIVIYQVGSFYELYQFNDQGPDLIKIANLLNIVHTCKNKNEPISKKNPYNIGFPCITQFKYLNVLISDGYTVVVIDQISDKDTKPIVRQVTGIYSPSTYLSDNQSSQNNFIVAIYLREEKQRNGSLLNCIGMVAVDISTGQVLYHQALSESHDSNFANDEMSRFLLSFKPTEVLLINQTVKIENTIVHRMIDDAKYHSIQYQNDVLKKIYPECNTLVQPLEFLGLERTIYCNIAMMFLFDFLNNHNKNILMNVESPKQFNHTMSMILSSDCIEQLDIINAKSKIDLLRIVDHTSTNMGKRFLTFRLTTPMRCIDSINQEYDYMDILSDKYMVIESYLKQIPDIERLERRLILGYMSPIEFYKYSQSFRIIMEMCKLLDKFPLLPKLDFKYIKEWDDIFHMEEMKYSLNEIDGQIFQDGIYPNLEALRIKLYSGFSFLDDICVVLSKYINGNKIHIKSTKTQGFFLTVTLIQLRKIKAAIASQSTIQVGNIEFETSNFEWIEGKKTAKIMIHNINTKEDEDVSTLKLEYRELNKKYFVEMIQKIYQKNTKEFLHIRKFIAHLDFLISNVKTAKKYNYFRPKLISSKESYIECKELRHPIIERIITHEYIPHDINVGKILLFGINCTGKSSLMKAVGICVLMAQCGMFVASRTCEIGIFSSLFTRISSNDDLYSGLSSFSLEMLELKSILSRSTSNSLIIGDEVCRGTETVSAISIVASTLISLSNKGSAFLFTTHLHELPHLELLKSHILCYHLSVEYNAEKDILIYDRKLKEGSGDNLYGLLVAKFLLKDVQFMETALDIKNTLLNIDGTIIGNKQSRYNKRVNIYECDICKGHEKLETHHIHFQKDCDDHFVNEKPYLEKNGISNLIVLCESCHTNIHSNKIKLKSVFTTSGKMLINELI